MQALGGTEDAEIVVETRVEGDGVEVDIIDNGPGIAQDVMPQVFDPFFTTKPTGEGSGLGLGIARQIVDKHGGRVQCESRPGRTLFLRLVARFTGQSAAAISAGIGGWRRYRAAGRGCGVMLRETILCVDDEVGVLNALEQQLSSRFGHELRDCLRAVRK